MVTFLRMKLNRENIVLFHHRDDVLAVFANADATLRIIWTKLVAMHEIEFLLCPEIAKDIAFVSKTHGVPPDMWHTQCRLIAPLFFQPFRRSNQSAMDATLERFRRNQLHAERQIPRKGFPVSRTSRSITSYRPASRKLRMASANAPTPAGQSRLHSLDPQALKVTIASSSMKLKAFKTERKLPMP